MTSNPETFGMEALTLVTTSLRDSPPESTENQSVTTLTAADEASLELILKICTYVYQDAPGSFPSDLRLVSRKWNHAALGFSFQQVKMNWNVTNTKNYNTDQDQIHQNVWMYIREYTKVVCITSTIHLHWNGLVKLLSRCKVLETVRFRFDEPQVFKSSRAQPLWTPRKFPRHLLNAFESRLGSKMKVKLDTGIEEAAHTWIRDNGILRLAPYLSYSKLFLDRSGPYKLKPTIIRDFLLKATQLEVLSLRWEGWFSWGSFPSGDKFRAPKHLHIPDMFAWGALRMDDRELWDYSGLRVLDMEQFPSNFDRTVEELSPQDFPRLESLRVVLHTCVPRKSEVPQLQLESRYREAYSTFVAGLPSLEKLHIDEYAPSMISVVEKIGARLVLLNLGTLLGCLVSPEELDRIREACTNIKNIGISIPYNKANQLLQGLAKFPKVTIVIVTVIYYNFDEPCDPKAFESWETALRNLRTVANYLASHKTDRKLAAVYGYQMVKRKVWPNPKRIYLSHYF
ncbi:hypothetical protein G7Y89_g6942 [Cudoniella acicularis]|uniref:Uncharacterized protein n=1 Tax=Cudoniella acicularis TaxID=354080 RepID=A0A8H4RL08_9HELO|nr:hypothetical protein G7Y89_g6942 [Cudoniella acicularis]